MDIDYNDKDLQILDTEDILLERFAEKYLADALRIISTRTAKARDSELMYDAVCITTAIYMKKVKDGEIHADRVLH